MDPRPLLVLIVLLGSAGVISVLLLTDDVPCKSSDQEDEARSPPEARVTLGKSQGEDARVGDSLKTSASANEKFKIIANEKLRTSVNASLQSREVALPLTTAEVDGKMVVVDSEGRRVKLACVNWYGAHMENYVVNGLDTRPAADIARTIADLGFNCVRLPFSLEQFYSDPRVEPARVAADPSLAGLSSMEVLDATVSALTTAGLMVILNNHNSAAGWCCSEQDGEGLWHTQQYPEQMWLEAWVAMVERYSGDPMVVAADLRNELRGAHGTRPTWGSGSAARDWAAAAEKAGELVLEVNPQLLIIVEGLEYAGNLQGARHHPIKLSRPRQLVYSGHMYTFWGDTSLPYPQFRELMESRQTYVREAGQEYSAAYWLGETGTASNDEDWGKVIRYLGESDADWSYWAIDGYKRPGEDESYGLLESDYVTVRHPWLVKQLQDLM